MNDNPVFDRIRKDISDNKVMLYMKGTPAQPMCGFSAQVTKILESYKIPYQSADVLSDGDLREGIKEFANWPTIPQLYVAGKFVGGCDITMELHRKGQLEQMIKSATSA